MRATKDIKIIPFKTKENLADFLHALIEDIGNICEFNILGHQISDICDYFSFSNTNLVMERLNSILRNGLRVSNYGSIYSTTNLLSCSRVIDISKIIDYRYYDMAERAICLCAIPKFINIDGEMFEFSSFNGRGERVLCRELRDEYAKARVSPYSDHFKCCLLDAVKESENLPCSTILGVVYINEANNQFEFHTALTHFAYSEPLIEEYFHTQTYKIKKAFSRFGTTDIKKVIVQSYKLEEQHWEDVCLMDI